MTIPGLSEASWRKSTRSGSDTDCVEVAETAHVVGVRDSKDRSGPVLAFDRLAWSAFVAGLSERLPG
ncbi:MULTISPECIES: DUF397 domain-containing protein [Micromonospora]|uniref:DUF397 domain-containing protein n=1 Tax=Micromonospora yangpuensis TaxID=683228 RepID=A0A1C6TZC2_9ACTN|nr:DUF397 domain-containing protein [Micromonospora yangpuensis]GGM21166.1 DUF397 domain-containing protein [Micromonospora yangpuensis]SCL47155.1 protein of unknown function [Micromonospora yangpuensis]